MPTATDSDIRGYKAAEREVRKMARSRDNWMTPTTDANEADSRTDYGTWIQEEIEGWQGTDHFSELYGKHIVDMARDLADRNDMTRPLSFFGCGLANNLLVTMTRLPSFPAWPATRTAVNAYPISTLDSTAGPTTTIASAIAAPPSPPSMLT